MSGSAELEAAAAAVLRANWSGTATLPSRDQYPHQWSWDSAFISIGLARVDAGRARQELRSLFLGQWSSGLVPQIVFDAATDPEAYFPGPAFWRSAAAPGAPAAATSGIVQPPVHARAVLAAYLAEEGSDEAWEFLRKTYPRLCAWHNYLYEQRDLGGAGLVAIVHPWESGLDNSPMWDGMLRHGGEPAGDAPFQRRDLSHVDAGHRPTDADYLAYVQLATQYRDAGYADANLGEHGFVVEDPLFNALLLDAELCCARLAEILGADPAPHREAAQRLHHAMTARLWDAGNSRFAARDVRTAALSQVATVSSLVPLLDPWLSPRVRQAVLDLAWSPEFLGGCDYPLPSTSLASPHFDRRRYWRGPTWINTNWLVWHAACQAGATELADRVAESSLALVARGGFREYFDPISGDGLGAQDFSWSAALTLDFLHHAQSGAAGRPAAPASDEVGSPAGASDTR
ncbi:MAG TPA: trehalase family glycosidase [Jatrophihabitans sp.]|uniref:amylo-alpha-1,6-glucosidase n=1 Tax=Jatrophihabitans sp. TaxID=1932789 RepID=UPI002EDF6A05